MEATSGKGAQAGPRPGGKERAAEKNWPSQEKGNQVSKYALKGQCED